MMMKKTLIALAAVVVAAFPAQAGAHGGDPEDMAGMMSEAMEHPLAMHGNATVRIVHVTNGCHAWSDGAAKAAGLRVTLRRGQSLTVVNQDFDTHQLVRLSGPRVALGPRLKMGQRYTLRFTTPGVYRLRTRIYENPAMPDVKTTGADNPLPIVVVVR